RDHAVIVLVVRPVRYVTVPGVGPGEDVPGRQDVIELPQDVVASAIAARQEGIPAGVADEVRPGIADVEVVDFVLARHLRKDLLNGWVGGLSSQLQDIGLADGAGGVAVSEDTLPGVGREDGA